MINGIQQIGVGVEDADTAWKWYRSVFGLNLPMFNEQAEAPLMTRYTGGKVEKRHAILAVNLNGGGGFEIWQFVSRTPESAERPLVLGDTGINITCLKCRDIHAFHDLLKSKNIEMSGIAQNPDGTPVFYIKDPYGNFFQMAGSPNWFRKNHHLSGGVKGAIVGVSDMEEALGFYRDALGFSIVEYDVTGSFGDHGFLPKEGDAFRRVKLSRPNVPGRGFSNVFGEASIELAQCLTRNAVNRIFDNRFWGDLGFIHLCFDVNDLDGIERNFQSRGFSFTVDSKSSFDMGDAAGRFAYVEDPDGTLIEMVETHKVPIIKKWGWYLNVGKRYKDKPVPGWMIKSLAFNEVKD